LASGNRSFIFMRDSYDGGLAPRLLHAHAGHTQIDSANSATAWLRG